MILGRRERAFLIGSLFHRHLDVEAIRRDTGAGIDWASVAAAAARAGMEPSVWNAAQEAGVEGNIPSALRERLASAHQRNTAANAATLALLGRVQRQLAALGIEALPLKGAALLLLDPALLPLRHVDDLDLLVRPGDAARAAAALVEEGWRLMDDARDFSGVPLAESARSRMHHGVTVLGPTGLTLELHHALPSTPGRPRQVDGGLFERAIERPFGRGVIRCPSAEDVMAMICEHALVHHRDQLMPLPRLAADLQALGDLGADSARAQVLWDAEAGDAVREGLGLLAETLASARRPGVFGRGRVERLFSPLWRQANLAWFALRDWANAPRVFAGAVERNGWRAVIPARSYMAARYGVSPTSPVLPFLYVWRPLRGAVKLVFRR